MVHNEAVYGSIKEIALFVKQKTDELHNSIEELKKSFSESVRDTNKRLGELEKTLKSQPEKAGKPHEMYGLKSRINDVEKQILDVKSAISTQALQSTIEDKSMVEAHVKRLDEMETKLNEISKAISRGTDSIMLEKLKSEITEQLDKKLTAYEDALKASLSPKYDEDLTNKFAAHSKDLEAMGKNIEQINSQLKDISEKYSKLAWTEEHEDLINDLTEIKRNYEEESALRISTDKALQDIEKKINDIDAHSNAIEAKMKSEQKMPQQYSKEIPKHVEENIKMEAIKIVTRHLDEFSKTLDKKLPNIATKDDLARMEAKLNQNIERRTRYLRPMSDPMLARRMENIERNMRDIMYLLKTMNMGHPFVVE